MSVHVLSKLAAARLPRDPPERWELTGQPIDWRYWRRDSSWGHPFVPRSEEDAPEGSFEALHRSCGTDALDELFVIPKSVRNVRNVRSLPRTLTVVTPAHVLGIGESGIGLWVTEPHPHVESVIDYDSFAAIDHVHIFLYGRMRFLGEGQDVTLRYNTVADYKLNPAVRLLRRRVAGQAFEVPENEGPDDVLLPFKWNLIARSPFLTLEPGAPVAVAFARRPARAWKNREHGALLALTPFELIFLHEPYEAASTYGTDGSYLPRSRIDELRFEREKIVCRVKGRSLELVMPASLVEAGRRWFATLRQ